MYITGKKIGCYHNKWLLKKQIFAYVYKKAMLINLGARIKDLYVLLKKQFSVFTPTCNDHNNDQNARTTNSTSNIYFVNKIDVC